MAIRFYMLFLLLAFTVIRPALAQTVVRYNVAGYTQAEKKMLVVASKNQAFILQNYKLVSAANDSVVLRSPRIKEKDYGRFGPFEHSFRVDISAVSVPGVYRLLVNDTIASGAITIRQDVYHGLADFSLGFLRSQRCSTGSGGADSVHQWENYLPGTQVSDSTPVDVSGGWHNTRNNLQDIITGAAITGKLVAAYQRYPLVFNDNYSQQGALAKNGFPDILDEAKWGLDWLIKMHPVKDRIYLQTGTADATTTAGDYRKSARLVQAVSDSAGSAKQVDAGFLSAVFADGATLLQQYDPNYAIRLQERAENTYAWALQNKANTFSQKLAADNLYRLTHQKKYSAVAAPSQPMAGNPLLFADLPKSTCVSWKPELDKMLRMAERNAFYYPLTFDSASNAMLVDLALGALRYREICGDSTYYALEQPLTDWLLGCNPWGLAMISGLPGTSAVQYTYNSSAVNSMAGAIVSGPVKAADWRQSEGTSLLKIDDYEAWQSAAAVYHDDAADFVTNQALPDATAGFILLMAARANASLSSTPGGFLYNGPVIIRGDSVQKKLAICFVVTEKGSGLKTILQILASEKTRASFFFTPEFLAKNKLAVQQAGTRNYLGYASSNFADQQSVDGSLAGGSIVKPAMNLPGVSGKVRLLTAAGTEADTISGSFAIAPTNGASFMEAAAGAGSPEYVTSDSIFRKIMGKAREMPYGLNGGFLLLPAEADPTRPDKFHMLLPLLIQDLKNEGYTLVRADEMLGLKAPPVQVERSKSRHPAVKKKKSATKKRPSAVKKKAGTATKKKRR